jgi:hypothetical protein
MRSVDAYPFRSPLYASEDLLAPRGKFSPEDLINALHLSTVERKGPMDRPFAKILAQRFLVVYVRERDVAALEDNLDMIRQR